MLLLKEEYVTDAKPISQFWTWSRSDQACWLALGLILVHNPVVDGGRSFDYAWYAFAPDFVKTKH